MPAKLTAVKLAALLATGRPPDAAPFHVFQGPGGLWGTDLRVALPYSVHPELGALAFAPGSYNLIRDGRSWKAEVSFADATDLRHLLVPGTFPAARAHAWGLPVVLESADLDASLAVYINSVGAAYGFSTDFLDCLMVGGERLVFLESSTSALQVLDQNGEVAGVMAPTRTLS